MAVSFPPSPPTGTLATDNVTGAVWRWDGNRWMPGLTGGLVILPGVTDGSKAAPGIVGEVFWLHANIPYPEAINISLTTLGNLPPGDWDCWALASVTTLLARAEVNNIPTGAQDPAGTPLPPGVEYWGTAVDVPFGSQIQVNTNVGTARISVATPVQARVTTQGMPGSGAGVMAIDFWARRVR